MPYAAFGRSWNIVFFQMNLSLLILYGAPSTEISMLPPNWTFRPVAWTMISGFKTWPSRKFMESSVTLSITPVTTFALPCLSASKKSPFGQKHILCCHGMYFGWKWGSRLICFGSSRSVASCTVLCTYLGKNLHSLTIVQPNQSHFHRMSVCAHVFGSQRRKKISTPSSLGELIR